jgi:hypothetical protein
MKKMFSILFAVFTLINAHACSYRAWYEGAQQTQYKKCDELGGTERQKCLDEMKDMNYDEYQRERDKILEDD